MWMSVPQMAVFLMLTAVAYLIGASRYRLGTLSNPSFGFVPCAVGVLLSICALVYLVEQFRHRKLKPSAHDEIKEDLDYPTLIGIGICLFAYPFLLKWVYYISATTVLVFAMLRLMGVKGRMILLAASLTVSISCYVVFALILKVSLPDGPVELIFLSLM